MANNRQYFEDFLTQVLKCPTIRQGIDLAQHKYNIKAYVICDITTGEARKLYDSIYSKFYKNDAHFKCSNWFENELRLFVWIAICYGHLKNTPIQTYGNQDWMFFSRIFNHKDPKLFEYQCHCMYLENKGLNWQLEQQNILKQIMEGNNQKQSKVKWNQVSKQLFHMSSKKFLRTPKQCRQRWNNHLDPTKIKGMWKRQQYLKMFDFVKQHGKKWASLVKVLNNSRNQHSIKNKFNSMVKRHIKSNKQKNMKQPLNQNQLYDQILQKVRSAIQNQKNCKNPAEFQFDLDDEEDIRPVKRLPLIQEKPASNYAQKFIQKLKGFGKVEDPSKNKQTFGVKQQLNSNRSKSQVSIPLKVEQKQRSLSLQHQSQLSQQRQQQFNESSELGQQIENQNNYQHIPLNFNNNSNTFGNQATIKDSKNFIINYNNNTRLNMNRNVSQPIEQQYYQKTNVRHSLLSHFMPQTNKINGETTKQQQYRANQENCGGQQKQLINTSKQIPIKNSDQLNFYYQLADQ